MGESYYDEIIVLKSIYEDELKISETDDFKEIVITITPATADDESTKYVYLDLSIKIPPSYPVSPPQFAVTKSRGLSDEYLLDLSKRIQILIDGKKGESVLFDMLDLVRENLTDNNIPSDICSICLCGFESGSDFLKSSCFHYFHRYCLKDYKNHISKDTVDGILSLIEGTDNLSIAKPTITIPCPVCKAAFDINVASIDDAVAPKHEELYVDFDLVKKENARFEKIYRSQLENGGLIDLEKEKDMFLLSNIQKKYEKYKAAATTDHPTNSGGDVSESTSKIRDSNTVHKAKEFSAPGHSRGRRNFSRRGHYQNHRNFKRFPESSYKFHHPHKGHKFDATSTSTDGQKDFKKMENQDFASNSLLSDLPTKYPAQNRGGYNHRFRRPYSRYRGSGRNSKSKDTGSSRSNEAS